MRNTLLSLLRDRRGSIAITSALICTTLVGFTALGVDVGRVFADRRKAQSTADLAAIAAVADLGNADKAAAATVAQNGYLNDAAFNIQYGVYSANVATAPGNRFAPSTVAAANAARVTLTTNTPLMFAKLFTGKDSFVISTTATASRSAFASFAIGSRLLKVDGGLLNQMLGGLLGANLSLSAMDYQSLIDARLDMFGFLDALAGRTNLTAADYDTVLKSNAKVVDVVGAMTDAAKAQYGASSSAVRALNGLAQALAGTTTKIKVGSLVDAGPYDALPVGSPPKVGVSVSSFDLLSAAAQIANGQHQVEATFGVNVPGIAKASVKLAVGERPQGTSWVTVGAEGASVHTAQTRLLLTVQVAGTGPAALINLPIYIEIASGTAALTSLKCGFPNIATSTATLGVTPGLLDAWIANVSDAQLTNFSTAPNPPAATLVDTPLIKVTGRAHATVSNMSATSVGFSYPEIQQQTKKTVGTTNFSSSLLNGLLRDTQLDVSVLGLGLGLGNSVVTSLVATTLSAATAPIDQVLASVLQTLGVGLGQADVWVLGIRCDGAVLVI